jgi:hypothetical protein
MGFLKQDAPVVDYEEWRKGTRAEKIVPMARHWAEVGFGTPGVLHLFYVVKILLYILGPVPGHRDDFFGARALAPLLVVDDGRVLLQESHGHQD